MPEVRSFPVVDPFDFDEFMRQFVSLYQTKGFVVSAAPLGRGALARLSKDDDGFKKFIGLSLGISVTFSFAPNPVGGQSLVLTFSDADWTGKIIAIAVGWLICLVPLVTGIIGAANQSGLPNKVTNDVLDILQRMGAIETFGQGSGYSSQPPYGSGSYPPPAN